MSHRELSDSKRESQFPEPRRHNITESAQRVGSALLVLAALPVVSLDRKSTRLNSSHSQISYAVFCLKKKTNRYRAAGLRSTGSYPSPGSEASAPSPLNLTSHRYPGHLELAVIA